MIIAGGIAAAESLALFKLWDTARGAGQGPTPRGRGLTVFCCFGLNGCDVAQRVGELLAAGPERRRLVNIADPVGLLLSEIEDGRLALQKLNHAVGRAVVDQRQQRLTRWVWSLDLGSPAGERFVGSLMLQTAVARHATCAEPTGATSRTKAGADAVPVIAHLRRLQEEGAADDGVHLGCSLFLLLP